MALTQKTFGPVTIDDVVSMDDNGYFLYYWDERYQIKKFGSSKLEAAAFKRYIPVPVVQAEAMKRNKMIGYIPSFEDGEESDMIHELTFDQWSGDVDFREEFDKFVQELAIESLNLNVFQVEEEKKEADALIQAFTGEVMDLRQELAIAQLAINQKDKEIEYLRNQHIKKAS